MGGGEQKEENSCKLAWVAGVALRDGRLGTENRRPAARVRGSPSSTWPETTAINVACQDCPTVIDMMATRSAPEPEQAHKNRA